MASTELLAADARDVCCEEIVEGHSCGSRVANVSSAGTVQLTKARRSGRLLQSGLAHGCLILHETDLLKRRWPTKERLVRFSDTARKIRK